VKVEKSERTAFSMGITHLSQRFGNCTSSLCGWTRASSPCPRKCASPPLPTLSWHLGKTRLRCATRVRPVATSTRNALLAALHLPASLLLAEEELVPGCTVIECDEPYTCKTCGACGFIHEKLGARKVFACPMYGYRADRDASATRNIMLRY